MNTRTKARLLVMLIAVSLPLIPLNCVTLIGLLGDRIAPMVFVFPASFTVVNKLPEDIRITPIAVYGTENRRRVMPHYTVLDSGKQVLAAKRRDLLIPAGQSVTMCYDSGDMQLSEILIRTQGWNKILAVETLPSEDRVRPPGSDQFVIDNATDLLPASQDMLRVPDPMQQGSLRLVIMVLLGIVSPFLLGYSLWAYLKLRRKGRTRADS